MSSLRPFCTLARRNWTNALQTHLGQLMRSRARQSGIGQCLPCMDNAGLRAPLGFSRAFFVFVFFVGVFSWSITEGGRFFWVALAWDPLCLLLYPFRFIFSTYTSQSPFLHLILLPTCDLHPKWLRSVGLPLKSVMKPHLPVPDLFLCKKKKKKSKKCKTTV